MPCSSTRSSCLLESICTYFGTPHRRSELNAVSTPAALHDLPRSGHVQLLADDQILADAMLRRPQYCQSEADLAVELAAKRVEVLERAAAFEPVAAQLTQARVVSHTVMTSLCVDTVAYIHAGMTNGVHVTLSSTASRRLKLARKVVVHQTGCTACVAAPCCPEMVMMVCAQAGVDTLQLAAPLQTVTA